jgi:hypothetical protein
MGFDGCVHIWVFSLISANLGNGEPAAAVLKKIRRWAEKKIPKKNVNHRKKNSAVAQIFLTPTRHIFKTASAVAQIRVCAYLFVIYRLINIALKSP